MRRRGTVSTVEMREDGGSHTRSGDSWGMGIGPLYDRAWDGVTIGLFYDVLTALVLTFFAMNSYDKTQTSKVQLALPPISISQYFISIWHGHFVAFIVSLKERFCIVVKTVRLHESDAFYQWPATRQTQTESSPIYHICNR
jgi:hypothetical protein